MKIDIQSNRSTNIYTKKELLARILWTLASKVFEFSPRNFFGWRRIILRLFKANVGDNVNIYNSAKIYMPWNLDIGDWSSIGEDAFIYNLGKVHIGSKVTISHRAQLCAGTHDYSKPNLPLLKPPITIKDEAWICASSFVGPGVTVNEGAIVGACAVVVKDVDPWMIVVGNPAKVVGKRTLENS